MKQQVNKKDLFNTRYSPIYESVLGHNWLDVAQSSKYFSLRINTFLYTKDALLSTLQNLGVDNVIQVSDTIFIIENQYKSIVTSKIDGINKLAVISNPSSLIPPLFMDISNEFDVIDICAAPGIKSSQIYLKAHDENKSIFLTSVEQESKRYFKMNEILQNFFGKADNIKTINIDSRRFDESRKYDSVLCDVPCSAEGEMIISDNFRLWNSRLINSYTNTQKALIAKAINLAKPGSSIVYSTCTLAPEENEEIIDWACKRFDFQIQDIAIPDWGIATPVIVRGIPQWGIKKYVDTMDKAIRIAPTDMYEGFFVAKLKKL